MKLTLGFSPCPNDTFIFDALIHHKIDTEGLDFEVFYDDVETLNQKAMRGTLDITKLSYHAFAYVADKYVLLDSGSALGFGVGPLLICKDDAEKLISNLKSQISNLKIGIPGKYTTANFLLGLAFPNATNKVELVFSEIEDAVLDGRIDIGLIIHENRFTYQDKGLKKIIDLGDYWEKRTGCAIPLGGIVANRNLPLEIQHKINRVIRKSVEFAFENPKSGLEFIRSHAQEMSEEVMYKHIELYVNKYSVNLGEEGKKAIKLLFDTAREKNIIPEIKEDIFLNDFTTIPIVIGTVKSIKEFEDGQLLLVNKPYNWTSFDVVGKIRNSFKPLKLKVGHAGTLDPLASGLLIICTGKMTKQIDTFQAQEKEYTGTMVLGETTLSYDMETEADQHFDISAMTEQQINEAAEKFIGEIQQYPPAHSAIKIDGERLYEKARRGEEVERRARNVTIIEFEITGIALPEVNFRVVCSKGTYIRSLVNDFGKALNNGAYLSKLTRTRSGDYKIEDAFEVMELVGMIRELKMISPI